MLRGGLGLKPLSHIPYCLIVIRNRHVETAMSIIWPSETDLVKFDALDPSQALCGLAGVLALTVVWWALSFYLPQPLCS